ncbi:carboxylesterase/lipase family protein [Kineococcus gynurae]|uniref:Carboxylic ester hydrolase n=1 Tax=Kineococcus gynurae TaxID=452979 RepID=A0ABV5LV44_9ACTN
MARVVVTGSGGVRGGDPRQGVAAFRGIPYAAPPVGPRRLQAPVRPEPWSGVREARRPSAVAPQAAVPGGPVWNPGVGDDYLTLDVFCPEDFPRGVPVVVWIHGGAYVGGAGSSPAYFPGAWVRRGLVVVAVNYRLGFEGFGSVAGAPDNRGLLDQVAALRWVQENIAAFGGDPGRVTVAGESAGAGSIAALLRAPSTAGLFHRAILQSVPGEYWTVPYAREIAALVATAARVPNTWEGFAGLPPRRLLEATDAVLADVQKHPEAGPRALLPTIYSPLVDGDLVTSDPLDPTGGRGDVDVLLHANAEEWKLFSALPRSPRPRTAADLAAYARAARLDEEQFAGFRDRSGARSPKEFTDRLMTAALFAEPTRRVGRAQSAAGARVHRSRLDWRSPNPRIGAGHAVELAFVFGDPREYEFFLHAVPVLPLLRRVPAIGSRLPGVWPTPAAAALAGRMSSAWADYMLTGDPGWPAVADDLDPVQVFAAHDGLEFGEPSRDPVWDEVDWTPWKTLDLQFR